MNIQSALTQVNSLGLTAPADKTRAITKLDARWAFFAHGGEANLVKQIKNGCISHRLKSVDGQWMLAKDAV